MSGSNEAGAAPALRYGVIGHPVAHSLSPAIHAAFARQVGIAIDYRRILAPLDGFAVTVERFFADGGRGLNVTLPFKLDACALCGPRLGARARQAGAVNWLACGDGGPIGDNTDGIGLVRDLARLLDDAGGPTAALVDARVLLIGAGGAARGVVGPLLDRRPRSLTVVNRDVDKAERMVARFERPDVLRCTTFEALADVSHGTPFDVVVNATSASIAGQPLPLPAALFDGVALAYDMMYAAEPSRFLVDARRSGARRTADGLGMLVEQAAESFRLWHGALPETATVLHALRTRSADRAAS